MGSVLRLYTDRDSGHPEELLDRARYNRGLGGEEREILQDHLSGCEACAVQFQTIPVIWADAHTTATDTYLERLATETVLRRLQRETRVPVAERSWGRASSLKTKLQLAAGILLFSGTAAAAAWWSAHDRVERPSVVAARQSRAAGPATSPASKPLGSAPLADEPGVAAPPAVDPLAQAPSDGPASTGAAAGRALAPTRTNRSHQPSAVELFDRARRLRLAGDIAGVRAVFRRLQNEYPSSPESHLSHLILGRLVLSGGRPDLAAAHFGRYIAAGGDAVEEALVGRASALREWGRPAEEAENWRMLLARYPRSVYAERARSRLAALERLENSATLPRGGR